ncbi:MAG: autotransporter domain-containing protein [Rhizobiales bacterium]|nr:autotransporter domain-containing protein [Hyphomicrobiales bacterium]
MHFVSAQARRRVLLAATAIVVSPAAFAVDVTVPSGTTLTTQQTISGTNKLTVDAGGAITTSSSPSVVLSSANASLTVDNSGTISSTNGRAIRTSGSSGSFSLTLTNRSGALIEGTDDAIGINRALGGGTILLDNYGTIRSTTDGQALDFNPALGGTVTINNFGVIEANGTSDVVRPGGNATITNYGTIQSMNDGVWTGTEWDRGDGIDFQSAGAGTVYNYGTVEAAKHGITGDTGATAFEITNYADGLILGRNGSGINFDIPDGATPEQIAALSTAHVVNYGVIAGAALDTSDPAHANADGDGVDIDYLANIENHGAILGLGAVGDKDGNPDDPNISDAISIGGGSITNDGLIYSVQRGILVDDSEGGSAYAATSITNSGLIYSGSGQAITLRGNFADTITNSGVIVGDIDMGAGDGDIDKGSGQDLLRNTGWIFGDVAGSSWLENYGAIDGNVAMEPSYSGYLMNDGDISGNVDLAKGGNLQNLGWIGGSVVSEGYGVQIGNGGSIDGDVTLTGVSWGHNVLMNFGSIGGNVSTGIGNDLFANFGPIGGHVDLGAGDDVATLENGNGYSGSAIGGIDGGTGFDALDLWSTNAGVSTLRGATNFETLDVRSGQWTLGDGEAYSFGVMVHSGAALDVNTQLMAVTMVQGGATLSGSGSVSMLMTTSAGAVIVPGNGTSGTLTVDGNAYLDDATMKVGMAANGASNQLAVAGTAAINGGTVALDLAPGPYVVGTKATIVTAAGGVSGSGFAALDAPSFTFITPTLGMTANSVTISLDRNGVPFASFAQTANQRAVANALDVAPVGSALYSQIVSSTTSAGLADTYDSLSGEVHADLAGTLLDQATQTELTLLQRLRQVGTPSKGAAAPSQKLGYGEENKPSTAAFDALQNSGPRYAGWAQGFGSWLNRDSDGNASATDSSVGGLMAGADLSNDNYTLGLAGGYSWGSTNTSKWSGSADIETALLALYGGVAFDATKLRGGASMAWSNIDTSRMAMVNGIVETPQASYNATTGNVFGEVAYDAALGGSVIEPYAGLGWVSVDSEDFAETNAPLTGLASSGVSYDTAYSTLGVRLSTDFVANGIKVTPRGMLGWRHAFSDVPPEAAMLFENTGTGFTVAGTPIAQDSLLVEAGADFALNQRFSLGFTYAGSFADNADSNAVKLTGLLNF